MDVASHLACDVRGWTNVGDKLRRYSVIGGRRYLGERTTICVRRSWMDVASHLACDVRDVGNEVNVGGKVNVGDKLRRYSVIGGRRYGIIGGQRYVGKRRENGYAEVSSASPARTGLARMYSARRQISSSVRRMRS